MKKRFRSPRSTAGDSYRRRCYAVVTPFIERARSRAAELRLNGHGMNSSDLLAQVVQDVRAFEPAVRAVPWRGATPEQVQLVWDDVTLDFDAARNEVVVESNRLIGLPEERIARG